MATAAQLDPREALYEAYLSVSDRQQAEIIDGILYVSPRPGPRHVSVSSVLGSDLNAPFQRGRGGPGGWWILDEPELQLRMLEPMVPDLAGWRVERMPSLPATAYFTMTPDWICEVLSKSTESKDRGKKLPLYAAHGVAHVWLIDPVEKTLEVHALTAHQVRIYQGDVRVRVEPFEAIELDLAGLWSPPRSG